MKVISKGATIPVVVARSAEFDARGAVEGGQPDRDWPVRGHRPLVERLKAYYELTKPRLASLILIVAAASFYIAAPQRIDWLRLLEMIVAVGLLAGGIFALNHYREREVDLLMRRTDHRPLPSKRLAPQEALWFGSILTGLSIVGLTALFGWLSGALALFTFVSYVFVYTPLKRHTAYHTAIGALPGAMPPLLGWAAARGSLDLDAFILFGILLFWQFPHFLSIEMMYSDDYARAGIRVLPVVEPSLVITRIEVMASLLLLTAVSLAPVLTGLAGVLYLVGAVLLDLAFVGVGTLAVLQRGRSRARMLLLASVTYLPLLFGLLALTAR